ncbi:MAG: hypothetical protein KatS3mg111_3076 [Pirellulaceae bacterium]|nr:MAG: hypothetical protein KatS3mg111_3076 [Pirellulaceae bacterium]
MRVRYRLARAIGHIQGLRLGLRRRAVKWLAPPTKIEPVPFETTFLGGIYRGDIANMQEWHVYFFGGYELKELALIADLLTCMERPVAVDVGANLGGHTLVMARFAAEVHSFEPYPQFADRIEEQLRLNNYDHVHVHRLGLSDRNEKLPYFFDLASRNQGIGSFIETHNDGRPVATLEVVRADDYLADRLPRLDFLKIDIEGSEGPALAGMKTILTRTNPIIMMEVTETSNAQLERLGGLQRLIPFAFKLYRIDNPHYVVGLIQTKKYRLVPIRTVEARAHSYNILLVPDSRCEIVTRSLPNQGKATELAEG